LTRISPRHASSLSIRRSQDVEQRRQNVEKPPNSIIKAVKNVPEGATGLPDGITSAQLRRLKLEVPWLGGDKVKVLRRTKELLRDQRQAEALQLVRLASREQQCTIAWNAILEDLMETKKVNDAFRVYNDVCLFLPSLMGVSSLTTISIQMKKRAQIPDSYTYSTLFNGLTANAKAANVGERATKLWQSLNNPNSKVRPSILLTNAALKACASANDIDAVWSIAGAIPDAGAEAANSITYTTIFNAMRFNTEIPFGTEASEGQQAALNTATAQGRQIWVDIISRWTTAKLTLDEDLVCAMGRLLLAGLKPQDWDSVFSLVAQTMNIPREPPLLQVKDRSFNPDKVNELPPPFAQSDRTMRTDAADVSMATGQEFGPVSEKKKGVWVKPSNQTLTLLIETCQKMFLSKASTQYWRLLTDPSGSFAIKADSPSLHAFLRMLRQSKASSDAVRFVRDEMKGQPGEAKTFRIAMSTCVRNQHSSTAMLEATELMDIMLMRMRAVDPKAGIMYMKLALTTPHVNDTVVALNYMTPQRTQLHDFVRNEVRRDTESFLELAKLVISGFDRVISAEAVPSQYTLEDFQKRKATWTYAVHRIAGGGRRTQPTRSDEEIMLVAKKKALARFERKRVRDDVRTIRKRSRAVTLRPRDDTGLKSLESDLI
jgi:hypothetical protein